MIGVAFRVQGLTLLLEAEMKTGPEVERRLTGHLMAVGEDVARDIRDLYSPYSVEGAYGIVPKVFASGLWVVQTMDKSRVKARQRPNFGPMMYREAFIPGAEQNEDRVGLAAELAVAEAEAMYWSR